MTTASDSNHLTPGPLTPSPRSHRPALAVTAGVALTAVLASGFAYSATGRTATLSLDGKAQSVDYRGSTVADVLDAAAVRVGPHDSLVPAAGSTIDDGDQIALRRGRQVQVVVDGTPRTVWTTAASVDEALTELGLRGSMVALSASRSRPIPLDGFVLRVSTPKKVSITVDGKTLTPTTTAATVRDALVEAGIRLDADDRLSHPRTRALTAGLAIKAVRIRSERLTETAALPFDTERRNDADLTKGETKVLKAGKAGTVRRTVVRILADGTVESRKVVASQVLTAPVTRILAVGTKPRQASISRSSSGRSSSGTGTNADSLNWNALAQCESGGNPRAVNASGKYRGLYQFSFETWRGVGGSGDPIDASPSEQTYRAKLLYNRSGAGQWPECGSRLFS